MYSRASFGELRESRESATCAYIIRKAKAIKIAEGPGPVAEKRKYNIEINKDGKIKSDQLCELNEVTLKQTAEEIKHADMPVSPYHRDSKHGTEQLNSSRNFGQDGSP